jgi:hypothetical protein
VQSSNDTYNALVVAKLLVVGPSAVLIQIGQVAKNFLPPGNWSGKPAVCTSSSKNY